MPLSDLYNPGQYDESGSTIPPKQNLLSKLLTSAPDIYKKDEPTNLFTPRPKSRYAKNATTTGEFTMYNPSAAQTDARPREMASGATIYDGAIATGDRTIPFGTLVHIPQLNRTFTVEDRMNKRYDATSTPYFDIPTVKASLKDKYNAKQFGRNKMDFIIVGHDGRKNIGGGTIHPE